ncbi:MAG: hypothetical protein M8357_14895 [Desulfobulbaceae bacterium]|nr:hypothetical protein [Desulfobulbaceae bacterium]
MSYFFLTLAISFGVILVFALLLNFCRRRLRKTPHGLTGMCHRDGGAMCSSCREIIKKDQSDS